MKGEIDFLTPQGCHGLEFQTPKNPEDSWVVRCLVSCGASNCVEICHRIEIKVFFSFLPK